MATVRTFLFIFIVSFIYVETESKIFTRCELVGELLKLKFQRSFISNWVCLIEHSSQRNTAALTVETPLKKFYGLFQIGSAYCKVGGKGGLCNVACESLLNEDLTDDGVCATKIFNEIGFKYWPKWVSRCKQQPLPDITKCPEWIKPPSVATDAVEDPIKISSEEETVQDSSKESE